MVSGFLCWTTFLAAAVGAPGPPVDTLTTANGFGAAVYSKSARKVVGAYPHLYQRASEGAPVVADLAYDVFGGVRTGASGGTWLSEWPLGSAGYDGEGLTIAAQQRVGDVIVTTRVSAPFGLQHAGFVVAVSARNVGPVAVPNVQLAVLLNLHVGSGTEADQQERITWDTTAQAFFETGALAEALYLPLDVPEHHAATPSNPYAPWKQGQALTSVDDSGTMDDVVAAFDWTVGTLAPQIEATRAVLVLVADAGAGAGMMAAAQAWRASSDGAQALQRINEEWTTEIDTLALPAQLSGDERTLARRSLALLRAAQVRDTIIGAGGPGNEPFGQIPASLPPGTWTITWVRDLTYAVAALIDAGDAEGARDAMDFLLRGPSGDYESYVGRPYGLSVVRTYGGGGEESDSDSRGPNVELDGFGLMLTELSREHALSGAQSLATQKYARIRDGIAEPLVASADAATKLVQGDSSIWETHWTDRRLYAFTSLTASAGLRDFAVVARALGHPADADRYEARAVEIAEAMVQHLVVQGVLAQSVEDIGQAQWLDVAVIEAFTRGVLPASSALASTTIDALKAGLTTPAGKGLQRNDDGGEYDSAEWIVVDLWFSEALRLAGRTSEADALLDWVTQAGIANHGQMPELLDRNTAAGAGQWPMVGFGSGAYVHALWQRERLRPPPDAGQVSDAAIAIDASIPDASQPDAATVDASPPRDAATPRDAAPTDASSIPVDAGTPSDASVSDAAVPRDAGGPRDAGRFSDAASPTTEPGCQCQGSGDAGVEALTPVLLVVVLRRARRRGAR